MKHTDLGLLATTVALVAIFFMPPIWVAVSVLTLVLAWGIYLVELGGPDGTI